MGKKKTKKMRGKKTFGYGSKKKHRGKGSKGGSGMAGKFKHKKIKTIKENPDYFQKKGFKKMNKEKIKTINLKEIDAIVSKENKNKLSLSGYKVLGKGKLTKPVEIEANKFSEKAKKKIEESGGKAIELS